MNELNDVPSTQTVGVDNSDINQPLAVRRVAHKRRIPRRFGKDNDLLPSAQLAALSTYSQVVTPELTPVPTPQSSPHPSRSASPVVIRNKTVPNEFGLYRRGRPLIQRTASQLITLLMLVRLLAQRNMAIAKLTALWAF
jgi:hypothetical protein